MFGLLKNEVWSCVDAFNGSLAFPWLETDVCFGRGGVDCPTVLAGQIEESELIGEKWGIDKNALVEKLKNLAPVNAVILRLSIIRFWDRAKDGDTDKVFEEVFGF